MASSARIDEIKKKFDENPRRYFAPLANEFRKAGDLEQAILICEEYLPQQAGHMSGHIVYGQALFESGRLPESRTVFETALGLDPENLIALRHLGDIAQAQGEIGEARRWYDRVLEADPRNEEIQGIIAALEAKGGAPAPHPASEPSAQPGGALDDFASTLVMEAPSAEPPAPAAPSYAPPPPPPADLAPIDLDMDEAIFGAPAGTSPAPAATPAPMGLPVTPPPAPAPDAAFDSISLEGLEPTNAEAATSAAMPRVSETRAEGLEPSEFEVPAAQPARAEGLEPTEFEAPRVPLARAEGLETSEFQVPSSMTTGGSLLDLESSFGAEVGGAPVASASSVAPLPGLEESGAAHPPAADEPPMPTLDLDEGLAVPSMATSAPSAPIADVPLGEAAAQGAENPRLEPPAAMEAMPALALEGLPMMSLDEEPAPARRAGDETAPARRTADEQPLPMMELPPEVIAAESALMDLPVIEGTSEAVAGAQPTFVTETMAELYLKQGLHAQAVDVYRQLSSASPADARLRQRLAELEAEAARGANGTAAGPTVREFFFRLATRRPGERQAEAAPPSDDDFASFDSFVETPAPAPAPAAPASQPLPMLDTSAPIAAPAPAPAPASPAPAAPSGTIDALFGTRPASASPDSAASALAQAFGGATEAPVITGRPARAASAELSLDSVFRDGPPRPPRTSQSFSFDQFFSESAAAETGAAATSGADAPSAGEPAERSADDVKQFNSWLQGLKPR